MRGNRTAARARERSVLPILAALSFAHLLNDTMQSLIPAIYPILKDALQLDFRHIGLITLVNQLTASLLQPFVGLYTDRRPQPYSLALGNGFHARRPGVARVRRRVSRSC